MSTRRLSFETLENRRLLASIVQAVVNSKGDLIVTGDKGDDQNDQDPDQVSSAPSSFEVRGLGGTKVNTAGDV